MKSKINLQYKISSPEGLLNHIDGETKIIGLKETGLDFKLKNWEVNFKGEGNNPEAWLSLLSHPNIKSININNTTSNLMELLPNNIENILIKNYNHINYVQEWIENKNTIKNKNLKIKYTGGHSTYSPTFNDVNINITHLEIPLIQDPYELLERNPHLETIGFDIDHQNDHSPLYELNKKFIVWSRNPHYLTKMNFLYPQHEFRLLK